MVMIVDDNREFLEELQETLSLNGYDTTAFSDGASALKMVNKVKPDIILLDLKLDKKSGFRVADELKHLPETTHIPIIAMTGFYTEKEHRILMNTCDIHTCIIKPFSPLDLIEEINEILQEKGNSDIA